MLQSRIIIFATLNPRFVYMSSVFNKRLPITNYRKGRVWKRTLLRVLSRVPPDASLSVTKAHAVRHALLRGKTDEIVEPANVFKFTDGFTCTSENGVYAVVCKHFKTVYLGETHQSVAIGKDWLVGEHLREANHNVDDMKVTVLVETCFGEKQPEKFLQQRIISFLWDWPSLWNECPNLHFLVTITRFIIAIRQLTYKFMIFRLELYVYFTWIKIWRAPYLYGSDR